MNCYPDVSILRELAQTAMRRRCTLQSIYGSPVAAGERIDGAAMDIAHLKRLEDLAIELSHFAEANALYPVTKSDELFRKTPVEAAARVLCLNDNEPLMPGDVLYQAVALGYRGPSPVFSIVQAYDQWFPDFEKGLIRPNGFHCEWIHWPEQGVDRPPGVYVSLLPEIYEDMRQSFFTEETRLRRIESSDTQD